ncbi:choice-of-anchor G family protein [Lysinimonas soli]|uniref:Choice-of-anchor G family protein n=1 Tax=Lysinimonas soli TaxID=1074233 RepID=A0ABW0NSD5_9MICO
MVALLLAGFAALSVPAVAQGATPVVAQGAGRLLTAELANSGIDSLLALNGASAVDPYGLGNVTSDTPLDATALGLLHLQVSGVDLFGSSGIIQLGAVGQYAGANNDASSVAFSGTVSDASSLVGAGTVVTGSNVGTPGAGDSASIDVGTAQILGGTDLVDLQVGVGAVAASAAQTSGGTQSGAYTVSNLNVGVGGTVLGGTIGTLNTALAPVLAALSGLGVTVPNPLASGQLTVSLDDLLAAAGVANIGLLPPGTNLLAYLPLAVSTKLTTVVNTLLTDLNTAVSGLGLVDQLVVAPLLATAEGLITPILAALTTTLAAPLDAAVEALLQLDVNNQSSSGGAFTQNALTIGIGTAGSLARVRLANATVGPNAGIAGVTPTISGLTPTLGPESGGTSVVITGTNFTGATSVMFGATAATSFTVDSDTQITAVSPPHVPATVGVTVSNPAGTSNPGDFTFTPLISVTRVDPNVGPEGGGTAVTITGVCFTGATGVVFGGLPATAFTVVDDTTITVTTPPGTGLVDVTVHGSLGCGGDATLPNAFRYVRVALAMTGEEIAPMFGVAALFLVGGVLGLLLLRRPRRLDA